VFSVNCAPDEIRDYFVRSMSFVENEFDHFVKLKSVKHLLESSVI
jgi:hypothetical protein